jgi:ATP-dependent exoDNAse (exonuclease V) alpha subunit
LPSEDFNLETGENWLHIEESDPHKIAQIIVDIHDNTTRDKMWDLQVISPQNDSDMAIACENLNQLLSRKLNPLRAKWAGHNEERVKGKFGPGDKVVRRKNGFVELMTPVDNASYSFDESDEKTFTWRDRDYFLNKIHIVNGDIGHILDMNEGKGGYIIVHFKNPDRLCKLSMAESHLQLAYCITCHIAQGSGYPVVIFPLHDSFYWRDGSGLWNRELVYTMFSRVIDAGITVGNLSALKTAISRKTVNKRRTLLARFLKGATK